MKLLYYEHMFFVKSEKQDILKKFNFKPEKEPIAFPICQTGKKWYTAIEQMNHGGVLLRLWYVSGRRDYYEK